MVLIAHNKHTIKVKKYKDLFRHDFIVLQGDLNLCFNIKTELQFFILLNNVVVVVVVVVVSTTAASCCGAF